MRVNGVRARIERLQARLFPQGAILAYHRIADAASDPHSLCISRQHFAEHLEVLSDAGVVPIHELSRRSAKRKSPLIAITFDDGYIDFLTAAYPLLQEYNLPATLFVATGLIGSKREFWWDELETLLLRPGSLPQQLTLAIDGHARHWDLGTTEFTVAEFALCRHWKFSQPDDPTPRHALYRSLYSLLRPMHHDERTRVLDNLRELATTSNSHDVGRQPLALEQVVRLDGCGLIDVGAHSVTHPDFRYLGRDEQAAEVRNCKAYLEEILGHKVAGFAYPYGSFTVESVGVVHDSGFEFACTTVKQAVARISHPLRLPRIVVEDCDGKAFAQMLAEFVNG